jgi:hypothetical protein
MSISVYSGHPLVWGWPFIIPSKVITKRKVVAKPSLTPGKINYPIFRKWIIDSFNSTFRY